MPLFWKIIIVIAIILVIAFIALYIFGSKMQKRQTEQQALMESMAQTMSMLVIDKKRMKLKDAGLPKAVYEQTPKYLRRAKVPVVKAKIGPKIMTLMCDDSVFDLIPVKQEVKAVVSGIYITSVKGIRGAIIKPEKKKGLFAKLRRKADTAKKNYEAQQAAQAKADKKKNTKK